MESVKDKKVLIDTNILVYCADSGYGSKAKALLRKLKDNGNALATSEISCFELIKNAIDSGVREYYIRLMNYIDRIPVTSAEMMNGAILYHNYHHVSNGNGSFKKIESPDLIISGTVIRERGSLLLTANRVDFPMPFWKLHSQCNFMRKSGEKDELVNIFLLEFDYSKIKEIDDLKSPHRKAAL
ncbi:MAG: hypothetical protein WC763_04910 [Candidatus Paceibacterota bacterium]|jgi:predicted nucleic acid-binding protein